jgi:hypothetical protein
VVWGSGRHDGGKRGGGGQCLYTHTHTHSAAQPSSFLVDVPGGHPVPTLVTMQ